MIIIGLTGGIGSGKTTTSKYLIDKGYEVIDADKISRDILLPGEKALKALVEAFGQDIVDEDRRLKRKALAALVFTDKAKETLLNEITHSEIEKKIKDRLNELEKSHVAVVFIDAPLLFEVGMEKLCDDVWLMLSDTKKRIERVVKRDDLKAEEVIARMNCQMDDKEKVALASETLENFGTKEELYQKIDKLLLKYE